MKFKSNNPKLQVNDQISSVNDKKTVTNLKQV